MKVFRNITLCLLLAVVSFACKKEDDESASQMSFSGTLSVGTAPTYVHPGDVLTFTPSGLALAENDELAPTLFTYFKDALTNASDTLDYGATITYTVPDTLTNMALTVGVFAEGYYTRSTTIKSVIVDDEKSLPLKSTATGSTFADTRNGVTYPTMVNGSYEWLRRNLAYVETDAEGSFTKGYPYQGESAMSFLYGAYYTWPEAQTACPSGWRIPTVSEWETLGNEAGDLMYDAYFNGTRMWEFWPDVPMTDKYGFSAIPVGYATLSENIYTFASYGDYALFWADDSGKGQIRYIYESEPDVKIWAGVSQDSFAASVRCVRDK